MSKKYINQQNIQNFVYPNNTLAEYDIDIIHNINSNSVSGSISGFTTSFSGSNLVVSFNYQWLSNGAEPFIMADGKLAVLSVHMMTPDKTYYKPWRMIGFVTGSVGITGKTGTFTTTVSPSDMGVSSFTNGTYSFEVRMIGKLSVYPICYNSYVVAPTATPTPTPTPSPTPGLPPPTPTPTPSATGALPNFYTVNVQLQGKDGYVARLDVYQSSDNITFDNSLTLYATNTEFATSGFYGTPGYYYYFVVTKISGGGTVKANAYTQVSPSDFSPGPINGAWCGNNTIITDTFQLPTPVQVRTSIVWYGNLSEGCL